MMDATLGYDLFYLNIFFMPPMLDIRGIIFYPCSYVLPSHICFYSILYINKNIWSIQILNKHHMEDHKIIQTKKKFCKKFCTIIQYYLHSILVTVMWANHFGFFMFFCFFLNFCCKFSFFLHIHHITCRQHIHHITCTEQDKHITSVNDSYCCLCAQHITTFFSEINCNCNYHPIPLKPLFIYKYIN